MVWNARAWLGMTAKSTTSYLINDANERSECPPGERNGAKGPRERASKGGVPRLRLRAAVGRVAERAQQQRHVVMRGGIGRFVDLECNDDRRMERPNATRREVGARIQNEAIHAGFDGSAILQERTQAAVGVGFAVTDQLPRARLAAALENDTNARRGTPDRRVE